MIVAAAELPGRRAAPGRSRGHAAVPPGVRAERRSSLLRRLRRPRRSTPVSLRGEKTSRSSSSALPPAHKRGRMCVLTNAAAHEGKAQVKPWRLRVGGMAMKALTAARRHRSSSDATLCLPWSPHEDPRFHGLRPGRCTWLASAPLLADAGLAVCAPSICRWALAPSSSFIPRPVSSSPPQAPGARVHEIGHSFDDVQRRAAAPLAGVTQQFYDLRASPSSRWAFATRQRPPGDLASTSRMRAALEAALATLRRVKPYAGHRPACGVLSPSGGAIRPHDKRAELASSLAGALPAALIPARPTTAGWPCNTVRGRARPATADAGRGDPVSDGWRPPFGSRGARCHHRLCRSNRRRLRGGRAPAGVAPHTPIEGTRVFAASRPPTCSQRWPGWRMFFAHFCSAPSAAEVPSRPSACRCGSPRWGASCAT